MNWLSQMITTPLDLRKMYPAESSKYQDKGESQEKPEQDEDNRSNANRVTILASMGKETLTVLQIHRRAKYKGDRHSLSRLLRTMEKSGQVECLGRSGHGNTMLWRAK